MIYSNYRNFTTTGRRQLRVKSLYGELIPGIIINIFIYDILFSMMTAVYTCSQLAGTDTTGDHDGDLMVSNLAARYMYIPMQATDQKVY